MALISSFTFQLHALICIFIVNSAKLMTGVRAPFFQTIRESARVQELLPPEQRTDPRNMMHVRKMSRVLPKPVPIKPIAADFAHPLETQTVESAASNDLNQAQPTPSTPVAAAASNIEVESWEIVPTDEPALPVAPVNNNGAFRLEDSSEPIKKKKKCCTR